MAKQPPKSIKTKDLNMNSQLVSVDYVEFHGKPHFLVDSLLDAARNAFDIKSIETCMIKIPTKDDQEAIFECKIELMDGRFFKLHADASPQNVTPHIANAFVRMAETRAVGRTLRALTGVGTLAEEMSEAPDEQPVREYPKNEKEKICIDIRKHMDELSNARTKREMTELFLMITNQIGPLPKDGLEGYSSDQLKSLQKIIQSA